MISSDFYSFPDFYSHFPYSKAQLFPCNLKDLDYSHPPDPRIQLGGDVSKVMNELVAASQNSAAIPLRNSRLDP